LNKIYKSIELSNKNSVEFHNIFLSYKNSIELQSPKTSIKKTILTVKVPFDHLTDQVKKLRFPRKNQSAQMISKIATPKVFKIGEKYILIFFLSNA